MARAISVHHGSFGRAALYEHNKPLTTHAHREGHLIFFLGGSPGQMKIGDRQYLQSKTSGFAISPWEPHSFQPAHDNECGYVLSLYIKPMWFLENSKSAEYALSFGTPVIDLTPAIEMWVGRLTSLLLDDRPSEHFDGFLFETTRNCFDQSWRSVEQSPQMKNFSIRFNDFRVRRSLRTMQENFAEDSSMDELARQAGLSRPHFFKLFKMQMGITPNLYLNMLRTEHAIGELVSTDKSVTDIGLDLGFASQASFTRFFISNVGIPPTDYRRVAHVI